MGVCGQVSPLVFSGVFGYNHVMVVQVSNSSDKREPSTELLPFTHNDFFVGTFQMLRLAKAFLRVVLPSELLDCVDLDALTTEEPHLTDEVFKNLHADMVYRVPIKGTEQHVDFFVILEHKSGNKFWTILQLWGYVCYVIRREFDKAGQATVDYRLPPVIAIIVHHGKSKFTGKTELSELFLQLPGIEKYLPKLQAILVDLNTIADDDVPNDPDAPELKLVLMALKLIFRKDAETKLTAILEESESISDDPIFKDVVRMVWHYFVASAKYMEHDYSVLYDTIKKIVEVEDMPTMYERGIADAVAKAKAEMVLKALRKKFSNVPSEVEEAILSMSDTTALESLLEHAIQSDTLEEFADALK